MIFPHGDWTWGWSVKTFSKVAITQSERCCNTEECEVNFELDDPLEFIRWSDY